MLHPSHSSVMAPYHCSIIALLKPSQAGKSPLALGLASHNMPNNHKSGGGEVEDGMDQGWRDFNSKIGGCGDGEGGECLFSRSITELFTPFISLLQRIYSISTHTTFTHTHTQHISTIAPSKATDPVWNRYQSIAPAARSF